MEEDKSKSLEFYGVRRPEENEKALVRESELWESILREPENGDPHKEYVGHVIRSGLLKEASRRYGPLIEDSESYSIETRRLARFYQKQIVNLMFMTPSTVKIKQKNPAIGYILAFFAMMATLIGFLDGEFWYVTLAGLLYLAPYLYIKFRQARKRAERNQPPGATSTQL